MQRLIPTPEPLVVAYLMFLFHYLWLKREEQRSSKPRAKAFQRILFGIGQPNWCQRISDVFFDPLSRVVFSPMTGSRRILIISEDPRTLKKPNNQEDSPFCASSLYCLGKCCDMIDAMKKEDYGRILNLCYHNSSLLCIPLPWKTEPWWMEVRQWSVRCSRNPIPLFNSRSRRNGSYQLQTVLWCIDEIEG